MTKKDSLSVKEHLKIYKELLKKDPVLQVVKANREGDIKTLKRLFFQDKKVDILRISEVESWNWLHRCNLLNPGPVNVMQFYIDHGVPINAQDCYGMTPLHYAMRAKNVEGAIALLNAGADPNIPNIDNVIPLANIGGVPERLDLLKLMLDKGGNVHFHNGQHELLAGMKKYLGDNEKFIPVIKLMEKYA